MTVGFLSGGATWAGEDDRSVQVEVKSGDTLQKISDRYFGTTRRWKEIQLWNAARLKNSSSLTVGSKLILLGVNAEQDEDQVAEKAVAQKENPVFSAHDPATEPEEKVAQAVDMNEKNSETPVATTSAAPAASATRAPASVMTEVEGDKSLDSVRDFAF
jgi:hypothetical protein